MSRGNEDRAAAGRSGPSVITAVPPREAPLASPRHARARPHLKLHIIIIALRAKFVPLATVQGTLLQMDLALSPVPYPALRRLFLEPHD